MTFEDTIRQVLRDELVASEERVVRRVLERVGSASHVASNGDRLLSPEAAAELTGYAAETIVRWARTGRLARYGTTRAVRVSERQLRDMLAAMPTSAEASAAALTESQILELARKKAGGR